MPTQTSFAELEYISKKKQTRRERFLAQIEAATPWAQLVAVIEPHYPKGNRGRPPLGLERMLRMYIAQNCFGLSDEGIEDALYDSQAIRRFVGIDLGREAAPDATTLLKFRRLLEENNLTAAIFEAINAHLAKRGLLMRQGTIVDATL
ncbi:transposase, partial [Cutibacterium acnes]